MSATNDTQKLIRQGRGQQEYPDRLDVLTYDLADALEASEAHRAALSDLLRRWQAQYDLLEEKSSKLARALEEIARGGVKFDAKGTWSKRVNEIAREALAAAPAREAEPR